MSEERKNSKVKDINKRTSVKEEKDHINITGEKTGGLKDVDTINKNATNEPKIMKSDNENLIVDRNINVSEQGLNKSEKPNQPLETNKVKKKSFQRTMIKTASKKKKAEENKSNLLNATENSYYSSTIDEVPEFSESDNNYGNLKEMSLSDEKKLLDFKLSSNVDLSSDVKLSDVELSDVELSNTTTNEGEISASKLKDWQNDKIFETNSNNSVIKFKKSSSNVLNGNKSLETSKLKGYSDFHKTLRENKGALNYSTNPKISSTTLKKRAEMLNKGGNKQDILNPHEYLTKPIVATYENKVDEFKININSINDESLHEKKIRDVSVFTNDMKIMTHEERLKKTKQLIYSKHSQKDNFSQKGEFSQDNHAYNDFNINNNKIYEKPNITSDRVDNKSIRINNSATKLSGKIKGVHYRTRKLDTTIDFSLNKEYFKSGSFKTKQAIRIRNMHKPKIDDVKNNQNYNSNFNYNENLFSSNDNINNTMISSDTVFESTHIKPDYIQEFVIKPTENGDFKVDDKTAYNEKVRDVENELSKNKSAESKSSKNVKEVPTNVKSRLRDNAKIISKTLISSSSKLLLASGKINDSQSDETNDSSSRTLANLSSEPLKNATAQHSRQITSKIKQERNNSKTREVKNQSKIKGSSNRENLNKRTSSNKRNQSQKNLQKNKIKKSYAKKHREKVNYESLKKSVSDVFTGVKNGIKSLGQVASKTVSAVASNPVILIIAIVLVLLLVGFFCLVPLFQGTGAIVSSSYQVEDSEILAINDYYISLENDLLQEISDIETTYSTYDEYEYYLSEIGHNPYELISYLSAKYHVFTLDSVKDELDRLFELQYKLVIESYSSDDIEILKVTLTVTPLSTIIQNELTDEEYERYLGFMANSGNRPETFDDYMGSLSGSGQYLDYEIPSHYLSDSDFRALIMEAEKYLGYPYVFGGSSPSTSFDCSGFVSWVLRESGVYNISRTSAQGIFNQMIPIAPSIATAGDIIFFTGTYNTSNTVTHVGIYVGDNMMIHCGSPISYADITSSYWQNHFYAFGRIPE